MTFLNKIKTLAADGPDSNQTDSGATHEANWVAQKQTGKNQAEMKEDADKLHAYVLGWQEQALDAHHIFEELNMGGGKNFEGHLPILIKGMSRKKLQYLCDICMKFMQKAPIV